jgi:DNA helicase-2/ATP-dependent DNA helicase PcrA
MSNKPSSQFSIAGDSVISEPLVPAYLQELNDRQREVALHYEGPILVLAGAGSGKTKALTHRIANLVLQHGVAPNRILAVTFTNKACGEMRERLRRLLGERAEELWVATFHSAALRMLRRHADRLGYPHDFVVYDDGESKKIIDECLTDLNIDAKKFPPSLFSRIIDNAKNNFIGAEEYSSRAKDPFERRAAEVYERYQRALLQAHAMDFGDLLLNAVRLLKEHKEILMLYNNVLEHVLIDEFQDTNLVQFEFVRLISLKHRNLLVVGDDDQSIYAFRGATIQNILEFDKNFSGAKVVTLDQNYRSTGTILDVANNLIHHNSERRPKKLWTASDAGALVRSYGAGSEQDEARFIVSEARRLGDGGRSYRDIAIFYRTNAQSRALEEALLRAGVRYRIFGGLRFYDRKEIKDIVAYLRLIVNRADIQAFLRVINTPTRGIGPTTVHKVRTFAAAHACTAFEAAQRLGEEGARALLAFTNLIETLDVASHTLPLNDLLNRILTDSGYAAMLDENRDAESDSRKENLRELVNVAGLLQQQMAHEVYVQNEDIFAVDDISSASATPPARATQRDILRVFLDRVSLTTSAENAAETATGEVNANDSQFVSLMTLHLAKGLEFPVVFLAGFEEGLLPHQRSIDEGNIEEERRLAYVGITRARELLYLSRAEQRGAFAAGGYSGGRMYRQVSRFASELPREKFEDIQGSFFTSAMLRYEANVDLDPEYLESEFGAEKKAGRNKDGGFRLGSDWLKTGDTLEQSRAQLEKRVIAQAAQRARNSQRVSTANSASVVSSTAKRPTRSLTTMPLATGDDLKPVAKREDLVTGTAVQHAILGKGTVVEIVDQGDDVNVIVRFERYDQPKTLSFQHAKLRLVSA